MQLIKRIGVVAALAMGTTGLAQATVIHTTFTSGLTTEVAGATVYDFDSGIKPLNYSGQGAILNTSVADKAAAPAGDTTPYLSVAYPSQTGSETFAASPGSAFNYFGLYWGSMDDYNKLEFFSGASLLATLTGADVIAAGVKLGDQVAAGANRYVNFLFDDATFDRIVFSTTQYAFESDNHAFATVRKVPEPGTFALMGLGLFAFGLIRKRARA